MKIGFTCGAFDLLHAGHLLFLAECKRRCDFLLVGLHVDPSKERKGKNTPAESLLEREIRLNACKFVNDIIVYETEEELEIILRNIRLQGQRINVRFLGEEYTRHDITAEDAVTIEFIPRNHPFSSSELRRRIKK